MHLELKTGLRKGHTVVCVKSTIFKHCMAHRATNEACTRLMGSHMDAYHSFCQLVYS